jgi:hypothetical protein
MQKMRVKDTDDAVAGVTALREILVSELATIDRLIKKCEHGSLAKRTKSAPSGGEEQDQILATYQRVRTSLLSGLASIDEVLGWVHMLAEKDPEGNELDCVRSLPQVNILPSC